MKAARSGKLKKAALTLVYNTGLPAPMITGKFTGRLAERAIEAALDHDVPVMEDSELTGILMPLEAGSIVPEEYWELLARVFLALAEESS